jgi:hypothetical protein
MEMHFLLFFATSHYIGAWKLSMMVGGICGMKVT